MLTIFGTIALDTTRTSKNIKYRIMGGAAPAPERQQGSCRSGHPGAGRPAALPPGHSRHAREPAEPLAVPAGGGGPHDRGRAGARRRHGDRHRVRGAARSCSRWVRSSAGAFTWVSTTIRAGARAIRRRTGWPRNCARCRFAWGD